jgi:hypothetical protein
MKKFKVQRRAITWHEIQIDAPDEATALEIAKKESPWEFSYELEHEFEWDYTADLWIEDF